MVCQHQSMTTTIHIDTYIPLSRSVCTDDITMSHCQHSHATLTPTPLLHSDKFKNLPTPSSLHTPGHVHQPSTMHHLSLLHAAPTHRHADVRLAHGLRCSLNPRSVHCNLLLMTIKMRKMVTCCHCRPSVRVPLLPIFAANPPATFPMARNLTSHGAVLDP